jgi:hypothetical protein
MSIAKQCINKYASLRIEAVFSAWSVQSGYKEELRSWQKQHRVSYQENVRHLETEVARKELGYERRLHM